jgi:hypothetical protein
MTSYSQILHFVALQPTAKYILSIKISNVHTSAVLKLLQQKYNCKKMPFTNKTKYLISFPNLYSVFLQPLLVTEKIFFKEIAFFDTLCALCALDEAVVHKC